MSQPEKDEDLDIERLRKQVSEIRTIVASDDGASMPRPEPAELNDFAKRVAAQFRDEKFSPAIMKGMLRLADFAALFAIGLLVNFSYLRDTNVLAWYMPVVAAGAALSVLFLQLAD